MSAPWYELQITGVAVGATLGFLFSYVPALLERGALRGKVQKALKADIDSIVRSSQSARQLVVEVRDALAADRPAAIYSTAVGSSKVFEANLSNIGALKPDTLSAIVDFYAAVEGARSGIVSLAKVIEVFNQGDISAVNRQFVIQGCESQIALYDKIIASGPELTASI